MYRTSLRFVLPLFVAVTGHTFAEDTDTCNGLPLLFSDDVRLYGR